MATRVEFYFDYGSPFSYFAQQQIGGLCQRHGAELAYRPVLLGGLFKATGNHSPIQEPVAAKRAYTGLALRRWARRAGGPFQMNPHFPIDTLALMRAAVAAEREGVFPAYHAAVFPAMWAEGLDMGEPEVVAERLGRAGLDGAALLQAAATPEVKAELRRRTEEAVARGLFGVPSFFVGEEMFFGNDHLPFVEEALR